MNNKNNKMKKIGVLAFMVQGVLVTNMALAAEDESAAVTSQGVEKTVDVGAVGVSKKSAKFGEYNGMNESEINGGFDIRGGDARDGREGTKLWGISASDLGTTSRSANASMSDQGKWKIGVGFDELRHNISDTYQTPLQGTMGGNNFTLPGNFGNVANTNSLNSTQLGDLQAEKVSTTRSNTSFGAAYTFNPKLNIKFDYNHLEQSGAKLIAAGSQADAAGFEGERISILMNPTNYKTDTFDLALNWSSEKAHLTGSYFGSLFRDAYNGVSWDNSMTGAATGTQTATMSTAPNNSLHQINLLGGYDFSEATKLAGGLSYGYNTQDATFNTSSGVMNAALPRTSLSGRVLTSHADLRLTNQTNKDLQLSAGVKYNKRDNRSKSDTYQFNAIDTAPGGTHQYSPWNTPYSNSKAEGELAADYRLTKTQKLRLAYVHEEIRNWCDTVISGAPCVANPKSGEDKVGLTYKVKLLEDLSFNTGYSFAKKSANVDHTFISPIGNYSGTGASSPKINGADDLRFVAQPYASRREHSIKAGASWQATDKLDFGLNGRYVQDKYPSVLGVSNSRANSLNLDASYNFNEENIFTTYVSWQSSQRDMSLANGASATITSVQIWANRLKEDSQAIGLTGEHRGMMGGKMDITGDLSFSLDKSRYSTVLYYASTCSASGTLTCGNTPDIKDKLITVKLTDNYQINKNSKVALGYTFQRRVDEDFYFNGYQLGNTPTGVMPTNEQAPTYSISLVTVDYSYTF